MNEQEYDDLFTQEDAGALQKKINHRISIRIYQKAIICILILALAVSVIFLGTGKIMDAACYNPLTEKGITTGEGKNDDFNLLLSTLVQMYFPGCSYIPSEDNITARGFGTYEIHTKLQNAFNAVNYDNSTNALFTLKRSSLSVTSASDLLVWRINEFKALDNTAFYPVYSLDEIAKEIDRLPDSSYLDVSVSFSSLLSMDELAALMKQYPDAVFNWAALGNQNPTSSVGISGGMSLMELTRYEFADASRYPDFYMDTITGDALKNHYLSQLQLLMEHPRFLAAVGHGLGTDTTAEKLREYHKTASQNMSAYGVRVYIGKKDLQKLISFNTSYVFINDVKLSRYQK